MKQTILMYTSEQNTYEYKNNEENSALDSSLNVQNLKVKFYYFVTLYGNECFCKKCSNNLS
jgi:hypothetical protein